MSNDLAIATITSLEVAEMVEKEHKNLIRDIKRYTEQIQEGNSETDVEAGRKIELGDFWRESTYKDANSQSRPCYIVTKKGCEFISHKLTGTKGTIFTARYINRFHDMENALVAQANQPPTLPKSSKGFDWLETSKAKLPLNRNWFERHRMEMQERASETAMTLKDIEDTVIERVFLKYDKNFCYENFTKDTGRKPKNTKEVISYHEELVKEADRVLYDILELPF